MANSNEETQIIEHLNNKTVTPQVLSKENHN